jgi:hypothetical protein
MLLWFAGCQRKARESIQPSLSSSSPAGFAATPPRSARELTFVSRRRDVVLFLGQRTKPRSKSTRTPRASTDSSTLPGQAPSGVRSQTRPQAERASVCGKPLESPAGCGARGPHSRAHPQRERPRRARRGRAGASRGSRPRSKRRNTPHRQSNDIRQRLLTPARQLPCRSR